MGTYLLVNCLFAAVTFLLLKVRPHKPSRKWWVVLGVLLVLTAVFDSMLVYFSFIDYSPDKILGIRIGFAPIEDFFYAIYSAILVPLLWNRFGEKHA